MGKVELRTATSADVGAIAALTREAYAKWVPIVGGEPLPMKADYAHAITVHRFDLLFDAGMLAGLIETFARGPHLQIENVAVRPALQGRGHGRRLLAFAEQLALSSGLSATRLYTNARMARTCGSMPRLAMCSSARRRSTAASQSTWSSSLPSLDMILLFVSDFRGDGALLGFWWASARRVVFVRSVRRQCALSYRFSGAKPKLVVDCSNSRGVMPLQTAVADVRHRSAA